MKTTGYLSSFVLVLAAGTGTVLAGCYGEGLEGQTQWPGPLDEGRAAARYHVERACRGYDGKQGVFQGTFAPNEERYHCEPYDAVTSFVFKVKNLNSEQSFDLKDDDCAFRLENEINGCDQGGASEVAGWWFSSDPQPMSNCGF
ncbi:hypothetical protein FDECE_1401 [Fusarium decemcellulare]|nr:hypothetical protein FDECE_1401 [Fusarium decemcellulare]